MDTTYTSIAAWDEGPARPQPDTGVLLDALEGKRMAVWLTLVLLAIAASGDVTVVVASMDIALQGSEVLSWWSGIVFSLVAVAAAYKTGQLVKQGHRVVAAAAAAVSVAVVAAVFVIRLTAAALTVDLQAAYAGGAGAQTGNVMAELPLASAFAILMIGAGFLAAIDGHLSTRHPDAEHLRTIDRALRDARQEHEAAVAQSARTREDLEAVEDRLDHIDDDRDNALSQVDAIVAALQQEARGRLADQIPGPTAKSGLDLPHGTTLVEDDQVTDDMRRPPAGADDAA